MYTRFLYFCIFFLFLAACQDTPPPTSAAEQAYHLIPKPSRLTSKAGAFKIDKSTSIIADEGSRVVANYLKDILATEGRSPLQIVDNLESDTKSIILQINPALEQEEGYSLSVNSAQIVLQAKQAVGLFYGVQTLRQLLTKEATIPNVEIVDAPRFPYRGMHLDVARHFFDVKTVKRFIDQLAYHKLNRFHWHLTEDQGWRIEIKQYPKLQEIAAFREQTLIGKKGKGEAKYDGKRYGGFYTQEEIKEVVAYASERFITIIPEIEMPGHAQAALAAYPELGCTGEQLEVWQTWGVSKNVFCPKEETFTFLENVLSEVIALFPSEYIHIGGDECPKEAWEKSAFCQQLIRKEGLKDEHGLQSYFIQRIERFLNSKGRQIIGWDEILEGGLAPNATVMSWRGMKGGIEAAKAKHGVIMTPTSHCYFDYYQSKHPDEPLAIGGFLPLEKVYALEPVPEELTEEEAQYILGAQANLWTEYITTPEHLEYMTFPRLSALAEVVWSPKESRDFDDFVTRLLPHIERLEDMGIHVAKHFYELKAHTQSNNGQLEAVIEMLGKDAAVHYTLDGSTPSLESPLYESPILLNASGTLQAQAFLKGEKVGKSCTLPIYLHQAAAKRIRLNNPPSSKYNGGGKTAITNGVLGSNDNFNDGNWLGFEGKDLEATIDFGEVKDLKEVSLRFFQSEKQWIYLPKSVEIWTSEDGERFTSVAAVAELESKKKVAALQFPIPNKSQYLKINIKNHGIIATGKEGAGSGAWLFIDEIQVGGM